MSSQVTSSSNPEEEEFCKGGYDYDFVNDPPSDFTCLICTLVAREAQQVKCCGKIFCNYCLEGLTSTFTLDVVRCPNCCEASLGDQYIPDTRAARDINQLMVYCINKEEGCKWSGELRHVEAHHVSCPHRTVECPNLCAESMKSMDLPQHLQTECPHCETECIHCGQIGTYIYISLDHLEECPDLKICCPNRGCNANPKRKALEAHRQECPKEVISCEYADLGCEHVCLREEMLQHCTQEVHIHLHLAAKEARSATKEMRTVRTLLERRPATPQKHLLKMKTFSNLKESGREWYSLPFHTFFGGYTMCLRVDAGGKRSAKGSHISVFLYLMAGENDEILQWPMRGEFFIELLNQERDENHNSCRVKYFETEETDYNCKVSKGRGSKGYGAPKFMSHSDLEEESLPPQTQYVKDDTLYFRVTMAKVECKSKPWLAGAIA